MVLRRRKKAVSSFEKTRAKTMGQFCRENSKTGKGGPGILPPEFDPENPPDGDLLVILLFLDAGDDRVQTRMQGQHIRDQLRANMPAPSRREIRILNYV